MRTRTTITIIAAGLLLTACGLSDAHQQALDSMYLVPGVTEDNIEAVADTTCTSFARDTASVPAGSTVMEQTTHMVAWEHDLPLEDAEHAARIIGLNVCPDTATPHMYSEE